MHRNWPHARAALIALTVVIGMVDGCPLPRTDRVPPGLRHDVVNALDHARYYVLKPFRPIGDGFNIRQRWKLFPVADRQRYRMWIEARGPGAGAADWRVLYRPHDDEHAFMGDALEYRRVRGSWNPGTYGPRGAYRSFVSWIAREIMRRDPHVNLVRVRMEKITIKPRGGGFEPTGEFVFTELRTRAEVMK
jgi:hypothetical protein